MTEDRLTTSSGKTRKGLFYGIIYLEIMNNNATH